MGDLLCTIDHSARARFKFSTPQSRFELITMLAHTMDEHRRTRSPRCSRVYHCIPFATPLGARVTTAPHSAQRNDGKIQRRCCWLRDDASAARSAIDVVTGVGPRPTPGRRSRRANPNRLTHPSPRNIAHLRHGFLVDAVHRRQKLVLVMVASGASRARARRKESRFGGSEVRMRELLIDRAAHRIEFKRSSHVVGSFWVSEVRDGSTSRRLHGRRWNLTKKDATSLATEKTNSAQYSATPSFPPCSPFKLSTTWSVVQQRPTKTSAESALKLTMLNIVALFDNRASANEGANRQRFRGLERSTSCSHVRTRAHSIFRIFKYPKMASL